MIMVRMLDRGNRSREIDSVLADELVALRTTHKQKMINQLRAEVEQYKHALHMIGIMYCPHGNLGRDISDALDGKGRLMKCD